MESEGDKASHQHPKWRKLRNNVQFSSKSVKDSILALPVLPAELITEILLRVPVKPLLRFRSVSKSWLALISSPEFAKAHLSVSANNKDQTHHRVMWSGTGELKLKDCSFRSFFNESVKDVFDSEYRLKFDGLHKKMPSYVTLLSSINGLICLVDDKYDVFLWNPSNRKYKKLPNPTPTVCFDKERKYGFGYDEFHDDYKLLGTFRRHDSQVHGGELMIYSLKSDSWRSVDDCQLWNYRDRSGMLVNGKLHWLDSILHGLTFKYTYPNIISFDLANEKWGEVEHPCHKDEGKFLYLGVSGSDLSIFCDNGSHVDFWVMKEYGVIQSWTKMFTVDYPYLPWHLFCLPCFMSNEGEILVNLVNFVKSNLRDASFKYSKVMDIRATRNIEIYVESLVCPFSEQGDADATKHKRLKNLRSRKSNRNLK